MDCNIIIGIAITVAALAFLLFQVIWSVRKINRIEQNGYRTTRETLKEENSGR